MTEAERTKLLNDAADVAAHMCFNYWEGIGPDGETAESYTDERFIGDSRKEFLDKMAAIRVATEQP